MPDNLFHPLRCFATALLLCVLTGGVAAAQYDNGSVLGNIQDASGAAVPGAAVQIRNLETGVVQNTKADASWHYEVPSLRSGRYQIEASAEGFSHAVADNIAIQVGGRQRLDLQLKIGGTETTVEVSDVALQVDTESSQRSQTVTNYQSAALPLVTRNYADLLGLVTVCVPTRMPHRARAPPP